MSFERLISLAKAKKWYVGGAIVAILVLILGMVIIFRPERSVTTYCQVYKQEEARLVKLSNPQYANPSGVFNVTVNDAGQLVDSFSKLDRVAPNEIEPSVKALQKMYQTIHDDPSQAVTAALSGGSVDDAVKTWTQQHCIK